MSLDTQNQLALHEARQNQLSKSSKYISEFLSNTDASNDYEIVGCPTCENKPSQPLFIKNNGHYCHCPACDHIFLANQLKSDVLERFYANYPTSSMEWHRNESDFYKRVYEKGISMLGLGSDKVEMLDIGCSSGYFLALASLENIDAYGVEPNKREAAYAIEHGIKILGSTIADLDKNQMFDIITLWDVLEHIKNPIDYLDSLRSLTKSGGSVFVQVPTSDSLAARVMRDSCNMFDGIEHLTLFSNRSLDIAFEKAGYETIRKQTIISESHALKNYLSYEKNPYLGQPAHDLSYEFLTADWIEFSNLGYKIQAVYKVI